MAQSSSSLSVADSLAEWLEWQEGLNPAEIELGLGRVGEVYERMAIPRPARIFTVAGTNGKGSCASAIATVLHANEQCTGCYSSPHLVRYNERIAVNGKPADDAEIVHAFAQVNAARGDIPLTYFEFGTLAALQHFYAAGCTDWVLEVGLGGRLDAVNVVDADVAVISTVDLDHQDWLGETIEQIAAEKAGIMRVGKPVFYGDLPVPKSVRQKAMELGAPLQWPGSGYDYALEPDADHWSWQGAARQLRGLRLPDGGAAQLANQALALAALESSEPDLLNVLESDPELLGLSRLPGRAQTYSDEHEWLLDVAHNPQAARSLRATIAANAPATVVIGMLADKRAAEFAQELDLMNATWLTCPTSGARAAPAETLADCLQSELGIRPEACESVEQALQRARAVTPPGRRILVAGSFGVVGPALQWLGLY